MNRSYLTSLKLVALTAAGLLIGSSAVHAQAPSPAGDWDIASSGKEMGLVVLTFVQDNASGGTLTGGGRSVVLDDTPPGKVTAPGLLLAVPPLRNQAPTSWEARGSTEGGASTAPGSSSAS